MALVNDVAGSLFDQAWAALGGDAELTRLVEVSGDPTGLLPSTLAAFPATLEALLAAAHVVVQGYRPGALARFGLSAADLAQRHPHLTVVTLSAWGTTGPWAGRRGFDSLVQCPTGIAMAEGTDDQPGALPAQVLDHATGYLAAAAALLSVAGVQRGQLPRAAWLSLAQTARWLTGAGPCSPAVAGSAVGSAAGSAAARREQAPEGYLVTLPAPAGAVQVIGPPGRAGDLRPAWQATTELGADPAVFA